MFQIMVVEDDKSTAKLMRAVLTHNGYKVFQAANGQEAFEMLDSHHIDLNVLQ